MEDPNRPRPPRINKFKPRKLKQATKIETPNEQNDDNAENDAIIRRLNGSSARRQPNVDTKSSAQVAFGPSGSGQSSSTTTDAPAQNASKAPAWDSNSFRSSPITLPLREPNSGKPAILDEKEIGEAASKGVYDENTINPAKELGLLDKSEKQRMFLVQLPTMPLLKEPTTTSKNGKKKVGTSTEQPKLRSLKEMPGGYIGKMLVYKSGAVKLKVRETLFDVSPGIKTKCDDNLIAIDTVQKNFCNLGPLDGKMVITPDIESMDLENILEKDLEKIIETLTK